MHVSGWSFPLGSFCSGWNFIHDTQGWSRLVIENNIITQTFCHACCIRSLTCSFSDLHLSVFCLVRSLSPQNLYFLLLLTLNSAILHQSSQFPPLPIPCLHHSREILNSPSRNHVPHSKQGPDLKGSCHKKCFLQPWANKGQQRGYEGLLNKVISQLWDW